MKDLLNEYLIRQEVMSLLSEEEIAQVSITETGPRLREGQEYLDLEQACGGIRRAVGASPPLGRVLPRDAVHATTWGKILQIVGEGPRDGSDGREP